MCGNYGMDYGLFDYDYGYAPYNGYRQQKSASVTGRYAAIPFNGADVQQVNNDSSGSTLGTVATLGALAVGTFALLKKGKDGKSLWEKITGFFKNPTAKAAAPGANAATATVESATKKLTASQKAIGGAETFVKNQGWKKAVDRSGKDTTIVTYTHPQGKGEIKLTYDKQGNLLQKNVTKQGKALSQVEYNPKTGEVVKPEPATPAPTTPPTA